MYSFIFYILCLISTHYVESFMYMPKNHTADPRPWTGRWFPFNPTTPTTPLSVKSTNLTLDHDGRIKMGVPNPDCDDGTTRLDTDWNESFINHTCLDFHDRYAPNANVRPLYEIETIPPMYRAAHACMNEKIEYDDVIPTFGTHRPLWGKWGEYTFIPKQRWLHNLEHGGVVMLYHPCANKLEVNKLKKLVKKCLYRHVITPYNLLTPIRPLALVTWGKRLQMSVVSEKVVTNFIKESALHGHEHTPKDGQYDFKLIEHALIVSDELDYKLCPFLQ